MSKSCMADDERSLYDWMVSCVGEERATKYMWSDGEHVSRQASFHLQAARTQRKLEAYYERLLAPSLLEKFFAGVRTCLSRKPAFPLGPVGGGLIFFSGGGFMYYCHECRVRLDSNSGKKRLGHSLVYALGVALDVMSGKFGRICPMCMKPHCRRCFSPNHKYCKECETAMIERYVNRPLPKNMRIPAKV